MGSEQSKNSEPGHLTEIFEHLYLGDFIAATSPNILSKYNIKHVVQLFITDPIPSVDHIQIPIRGGRTTDITPVLEKGLKYIDKNISKGENVLVHCKHGRNRSASIVIAYTMLAKSWNFEKSKDFVYSKRPILRIKPKVQEYLSSTSPQELKDLLYREASDD
ncbi:hypothetical protein SteCoe_35577 [Stentor coeruleus]|uniref:protein-tyrosine-phosphatase n=1 Tax=Stentor coeruleus TaxID=5963 RepID=A0A1R2AS08_9CILI|nr:hypothetical protein SteCoe_35577 [Stentor coeruleus]